MSNEVWIVINTEQNVGAESIIGLFENKGQAINFIGEYVLKNEIDTSYLELVKKKVEVLTK